MDMPMIGLGTWQLSGEKCTATVRTALDLGYTHIDTAALYGNHAAIGKAIRRVDRAKFFLTSKVWHADLRHDDVLAACDAALAELGTEYLDLYLIHWPNHAVSMQETFKALAALRAAGKVKAIGVSNFTVRHLREALHASKAPITCNQVEFHPMLYQRDLLAFCKEHDIQLVAYSPLAHGRLIHDEQVQAIAERSGKTPSQVVLRWILDKGVGVIPKASSRLHLEENLDLDFTLDEQDVALLDNMPQQRFVNPGFAEFQ